MGSNEVRKSDVRIVAATNVRMQKAIQEGKFREDLYYRLATIPITIPPLRERGDDILLLFRKFAAENAEKYRRDPIVLTEDGKRLMLSYKWPGNIRQLRNIVDNLSVTSREREIDAVILRELHITDDRSSDSLPALVQSGDGNSKHSYANEREMLLTQLLHLSREISDLKDMVNDLMEGRGSVASRSMMQGGMHDISSIERSMKIMSPSPSAVPEEAEETSASEVVEEEPPTIEEHEKQLILDALHRHNFNRRKAAQQLGISERTLYRRIREYGLTE